MASSPPLDKPLPQPPTQPAGKAEHAHADLTRLTIEGRAHLRQFIKYALAEEGVDEPQEWVKGLELALKELCASLSRGGWLAGLKAARKATSGRRREAERLKKTEEENVSMHNDEGSSKGKPKDDRGSRIEKDVGDRALQRIQRPPEERKRLAIEQLQRAIATPLIPSPIPAAMHLLLTLSPKGAVLPPHDMDFDIIPSNKICVFSPNKFVLPSVEDWNRGTGGVILYGLDEWDVDAFEQHRIVGGTFSFTGITSIVQFQALSKVLRLSVFVCLSLVLEQHLLSDSHVHLHFPVAIAAQPLVFSYTSPDALPPHGRRSAKPSNSGLWSFFARKTENLLNRAANVPINNAAYVRTKSLDVSPVTPARARSIDQPSPPTRHSRRLSFSLSSGPPRISADEERRKLGAAPIFSSILARITASAPFMSSSAGITFPVPAVLSVLAEKEKIEPNRKLLGFEKVSLCSLLGWEGRESRGKGMAGLAGFARHQGITFLYAEYAPKGQQESLKSTPSTSLESNTLKEGEKSEKREGTLSGSPEPSSMISQIHLVPCERGRWVTYRYFSREFDGQKRLCGDRTLGDAIESLCTFICEDGSKCTRTSCDASKIDHRRIWIHNDVRISVEICDRSDDSDNDTPEDNESITMWESCEVCQKTTERKKLTDGSYLFSFGKYLELLIYSPALCVLSPRLCDHTTPPPLPWSSIDSPPRSRFNIVRHFAYGRNRHEIKFHVGQAPALFEVHIPRLQVTRGHADSGTSSRTDSWERKAQESDEKKVLRKEIKQWWQCIADRLDKLDERFSDTHISRKSLPRLPSVDDQYEESGMATPKANTADLPPLPPSVPGSPSQGGYFDDSGQTTPMPSKFTTAPIYPVDDASGETTDPSQLLSNLRLCFQHTERSLYAQLSQTPASNLNEVRRVFTAESKGAAMRLSAWEKKHAAVGGITKDEIGKLDATVPDWWKPGCHTVPGSNVVVRESEWGSIIAFTLSSLDYQKELAAMSINKSSEKGDQSGSQGSGWSAAGSSKPSPTSSTSSNTASGTAKPVSRKKLKLDPDSDSEVWYEPEAYTTVIGRQDHPRDPSGLLSLRDVLRQRISIDPNGSSFAASKFSPSKLMSAIAGGPVNHRVVSSGTPPSAWSEPAVQVSMQAAGGRVSGLPEAVETAEKILQDMEATSEAPSSNPFYAPWRIQPATPDPGRRHRTPSVVSIESDSTDTTDLVVDAPYDFKAHQASAQMSFTPTESNTESKNSSTTSFKTSDRRDSTSSKATTDMNVTHHQPSQHQQSSTSAFMTASLASTVTSAVRYLLHQTEAPRPSSPAHHHKLLALENQNIEDRPHIKYEWTVGKRLKFNCTVYYAKQFEILRRRCGVDEIMPKSLMRCVNWAAEGGKSRSNFWKTSDERFIIKTLVNAWNVADLSVLLELAPSYFRYMESTSSRPSLLAKQLGFYSIEIKNLETGAVQSKADLLVMENLFYDQKVTKAFDLKGIQGRKVKGTGGSSEKKTLFDGDWIEDQQKALILVQPHSKLVLHEAIKADADFLCRNNIMDYSLLLGVDEGRRQIACGVVDTIGSYTFAKTLEYKAKQNLNSGKETTVIPPNEYHDRFITAINNYFIACPDKWSRPIYDSSADKLDNNLTLPSVL